MSADIFSSLAAIQSFLIHDVANVVPPHLRSEVRASAKLLAEIALEIDALPALLQAECCDMLSLSEQAAQGVADLDHGAEIRARLRNQLEQPPGSLRELIGLHEALKAETERSLLAIQKLIAEPDLDGEGGTVLRALQGRYLLMLAAQANARMPWQSVFPANDSDAIAFPGELR